MLLHIARVVHQHEKWQHDERHDNDRQRHADHRQLEGIEADDADSEGEEGKFFVWTPDEISRLLGTEAGEVFCRIYDVSDQGNFEEKNKDLLI